MGGTSMSRARWEKGQVFMFTSRRPKHQGSRRPGSPQTASGWNARRCSNNRMALRFQAGRIDTIDDPNNSGTPKEGVGSADEPRTPQLLSSRESAGALGLDDGGLERIARQGVTRTAAPAAGRARPAPRSPARGGWGAAPPTQTLSGSAPDVWLFAPQRSPRGRRRTVWGQRRHLREYLS